MQKRSKSEIRESGDVFGVNVLIVRDGKVLGVARRDNPDEFSLPGGKVDDSETIEQACIREIKEETGLDITNLCEIYRGLCVGDLVVSFSCDYTSSPKSQEGEPECKWVDPKIPAYGVFGEYNRELFGLYGVRF